MARFDVYAGASENSYLLDCQADLLSSLNTRLVVPLLPPAAAPKPAARLNPILDVNGQSCVMVTQHAAAIERRELGPKVGSLAGRDHEIVGALAVLITGV
jgi:toxin CcdB